METATLELIHDDLEFLKVKVISIEQDIKDIKEEVEPEVREEYLQRLKELEKEKGQGRRFESKEEFLRFLDNEI